MSFTKLFQSITASTIWCEDHATRIVWVTMLAMADQDGYVGASVPGLAAIARVSLEEAEAALAKFNAPDKYSRSREHDGRRIAEAEGGWMLLNYAKYREERDKEIRREQNAAAQKRHRQKLREQATGSQQTTLTNADSKQCKPPSAQAEAEGEEEAEERSPVVPLPDSEPVREPGEPEPEERTLPMLRRKFGERLVAATGNPPVWTRGSIADLKALAEWLDEREGDAGRLADRMLEGFFADPWAQDASYPFGALAKAPGKYLAPPGPRHGAGTGPHAPRRRPGSVPKSRGTTAKDFEHEPEVEEQMAAFGMRPVEDP